MARAWLSYLPTSFRERPPATGARPPREGAKPIADVIPDEDRRAYDVRKVIDALVDEASFLELLDVVNEVFLEPLSPGDVIGTWAGLRPLISDTDDASAPTADLSRKHVIVDDGDGLVTITGGKLTAYREMAEDAVDAIAIAIDWEPLPAVVDAPSVEALEAGIGEE